LIEVSGARADSYPWSTHADLDAVKALPAQVVRDVGEFVLAVDLRGDLVQLVLESFL